MVAVVVGISCDGMIVGVCTGDGTGETKLGMMDDDVDNLTMIMLKLSNVKSDDDTCGKSSSQMLMLILMLVSFSIAVIVVVFFIFDCLSIYCVYCTLITRDNTHAPVVNGSTDGKWYRAVLQCVAIAELLLIYSGCEFLAGDYSLPPAGQYVCL